MSCDLSRIETKEASLTHQFMVGIAERIHKINPNLLWDYCAHSRAGLLAVRGIEDMTDDQKALMEQHLIFTGVGAVNPMPTDFGFNVLNMYSSKDRVVAPYNAFQCMSDKYNMKFLPCISPRSEWSFSYGDHGFMGPTYQNGRKERVRDNKRIYGYFYGEKN